MRFLGRFQDESERLRVRGLLESRGIPVFAQTSRWTPGGRALFVCINSQYEDAVALLANENHEVSNPVDIAQFENAERTSGLDLLLKYALLALLGVVLLWGIVAAIAWWHGVPISMRR